MSLDFSLQIPVKRWETVLDVNSTHNVSPMFRAAGVRDALYESHGKLAKDISASIAEGLAYMESHQVELEAMNPANGWGSYQTALAFLRMVDRACREWPDAEIHVCA